MKLAIHQPNFLSRLKVLQKLASADCWVVLDSVQFAQREWQNRAKILPLNTEQREFWLTLPVNLPQGRNTLIKDVRLSELPRMIKRCRQSLLYAFRSTTYWNEVSDYWEEVEEAIQPDSLIGMTLPTTTVALRRFARLPEVKFASEVDADGRKSILMANICEALSGTEYLADSGALLYLQTDHFSKTHVIWQRWVPPATQGDLIQWRNLSFVNFLARHGAAKLRQHLMSGVFDSTSNIVP
jgi:hypothetical protein